MNASSRTLRLTLFACAWLAVSSVSAIQPRRGAASDKHFQDPALFVPEQVQPLVEIDSATYATLDAAIRRMGLEPGRAFYDPRVGRWSSLILSRPLLPGRGAGNSLGWEGGRAPRSSEEWKDAAWNALEGYLRENAADLKLDLAELPAKPRISVHDGGALIYVYAPRVVDGIPVRDNYVGAAINSGNLILLGLSKWGDVGGGVPRSPSISAEDAEGIVRAHVRPMAVSGLLKAARLEFVPVATHTGIGYRLAWVLVSQIDGDMGTWEGLVDAASGNLLAFQDINQYADGQLTGGAYPVSNDQRPPDGVEQPGWPMPFADFTINGVTRYTDTGGNMGCIPGSISTALNGIYIRMIDQCGSINEVGDTGLDLGSGPTPEATDCTVPAGHSPGDTKSSRSGFYELNRIAEQARGYLPAGTAGGDWAREQLGAVMNIPDPQGCNANWNGATVNFFRSVPDCRNTGEIAAIFDHEWGHGMDNNGTNPNIAGPGEAIADIYAALRLNTSCVARGFFKNETCSGYGDACDGTPATGCTGVRDIDFMNHRCDAPHTIDWILNGILDAACAGPGGAPACPAVGQRGPCNRETHCEGMVMAETGWDLMTRDLLAPPFNYDSRRAHEVATRILYIGAQAVGNWYTCTGNAGSDGCAATGGYLSILAADDDNGNLGDGTPHMSAIRAAFERHEIHCSTPTVTDSGCVGAPSTAPVVTLTGQDRAVNVSWTAVAGAAEYVVYRGEGIAPCDFGKVIVARTSELSFLDAGLMNGRDYSYQVAAVGASAACMGPLSDCESEQPVPGASYDILAGFTVSGGDGDPFLDNCEVATITFPINNSGATEITNVRIVAITPLTHPTTTVLTALPAVVSASMDSCSVTDAVFQIQPQGLTFDGTTEILVEVDADGFAETRTALIQIAHNESDTQVVASRTFGFETDMEGWTEVSGTFVRTTGGGANGTSAHVSSSSGDDDQCDIARSPLIILSDTSTLILRLRHDIELQSGGEYWDRANVSVYDATLDIRTVITPSAGRPYNVPDGSANGVCGTTTQAGWNGTTPSYPTLWYNAQYNAAALNPGGGFTDKLTQIQINYGTDESIAGDGFDFDELSLTNFSIQVPDSHSDDCSQATQVGPAALAVDAAGNGVLEAAENAVVAPTWSNTGLNIVAFGGTASSFTGPAGPTYDLTDAAGDYGSLDPAETSACTDCYAVSITAAARPQVHWDATVTETLGVSPLQQGEPVLAVKDWNLHVGGSFTDVPSDSLFYASIENVLHNGVTAGCLLGDTFCPGDSVTRQQMAVFLLKAKDGAAYTPPACDTPVFDDVPCASPFAPWINELFARGVTAGCAIPDSYCPSDPTNRQQMAVFLLKTDEGSSYVPPVCGTPAFDDVPCASPFAPWINELVARAVTAGCGGPNYCPGSPVARQQMAVFLVKTFGLVLYGP